MEIDIKQYNQASNLNRLIDSLHLNDNIIDIINEATELLYQKTNCDSINILFNNEKSRHFYINQTLNHADHENGDVLNIHPDLSSRITFHVSRITFHVFRVIPVRSPLPLLRRRPGIAWPDPA